MRANQPTVTGLPSALAAHMRAGNHHLMVFAGALMWDGTTGVHRATEGAVCKMLGYPEALSQCEQQLSLSNATSL